MHNSRADSVSKMKKASTASLKENIPDLEKLISDIKISPHSESYTKPISEIFTALKKLKTNSNVEDEVKAVSMLMQTIEKKINNN